MSRDTDMNGTLNIQMKYMAPIVQGDGTLRRDSPEVRYVELKSVHCTENQAAKIVEAYKQVNSNLILTCIWTGPRAM